MSDKEIAKEAFMEGYRKGQDTEELRDISIRAAESMFDRWWKVEKTDK